MQKHHAYFSMFDQISSKWFAGRVEESVRGRDTFIIPASRFALRQQQNIKVMHLYSLRGREDRTGSLCLLVMTAAALVSCGSHDLHTALDSL